MRGGGQPNMQQLMKQAQKMQQQLADAQAELAEAEVTGSAGGGLVTATVTGSGELRERHDRPEGGRPGRRRDAAGPGGRGGPATPTGRPRSSPARRWARSPQGSVAWAALGLPGM